MRGKPAHGRPAGGARGITPAHAGKTGSFWFIWTISKDHPRACGENLLIYQFYLLNLGSPPRMRGKRGWLSGFDRYARITPAHAGKTKKLLQLLVPLEDHPRACGENPSLTVKKDAKSGSPPRMRGKHFGNGVFPWLILVLSLDPL